MLFKHSNTGKILKSCCKESFTITVINYSGRASELGGIVNLVDRRLSSFSRSERPVKLIARLDDRYAVAKFSKYRILSKVPGGCVG